MRCHFRNKYMDCRAGHSFGFSTHQGLRIYSDCALKNDILMISRQSGFTVEFLVELTGQVDISSETFEAAAKRFNRFHARKIPEDRNKKRMELNKVSVSNAYFLFTYLEICQRYEIANYQIIKNDLNSAILEHKGALMLKY